MKTTKLFSGSVALTVLALTACSNELPNSGPQLVENDEMRYLRVSIASAPDTRAEFQKGTTDENKVNSMYFKFYDINGDAIEEYDSNNTEFTWVDNKANEGEPTPSVGRIGTAIVSISLKKGAPKPSYVIAFINPVNYTDLHKQENMQKLRDTKRESFGSLGDFAMSNSAYYGPDGVADDQKEKIMATSISEDMLYTSKEEASKDTAKAVDIYVERYAAKVSFTLKDNAVKDQSLSDYTLTFEPEAWTVNADAPTMYASKRFENSDAENHNIPTYGEVQDMLGTWTQWNDAPNHRSYWACSPSYYATNFPNVSDNIIDKMPNGKTGAGVAVAPYDLKYYSFNQITGEDSGFSGVGVTAMTNGGENYKYVMENTMGDDAFHCLNPKAAAPSLVLVGGYKIKYKGTEIANIGEGFCRYDDKLFWRGNVPAEDPDGKTIVQELINRNLILFKDKTGGDDNLLKYNDVVAEMFEVVHPNKDVRGTQDIPHRYVTLQLKNTLTKEQLSTLFYKPVGANSYIPLATETSTDAQVKAIITDINKQLWAQLGNARAYSGGKGYFSIPIQHLGMTENKTNPPYDVIKNEAGEVISETLNWKKVRVGDFGIVRNHVYSIEVSSIDGFASGIEDPDNPLVPSMEDDNYWVKYRVNILNWRVVPAQSDIVLK